jgi:predicted HTH transcriptional regulator
MAQLAHAARELITTMMTNTTTMMTMTNIVMTMLFKDRFVLTLPGPGHDLSRIKAPTADAQTLPQSVLAELNPRQIAILKRLAAGEELTSAQMQSDFSITRETVARDMATLVELNLAQKTGKARATRYLYAPSESSGIVR